MPKKYNLLLLLFTLILFRLISCVTMSYYFLEELIKYTMFYCLKLLKLLFYILYIIYFIIIYNILNDLLFHYSLIFTNVHGHVSNYVIITGVT